MKDSYGRQVPLRGEDLSSHVWEKGILVSCREKAPNALEARETVLTKTGESGRGRRVFFIPLSPRVFADQEAGAVNLPARG